MKGRALHKQLPDDVTVFGYTALGNWFEVESSTQGMLNMRLKNVSGLLLVAKLRVHYGDVPGALEVLNQAFRETPQIEPEELAPIANAMAVVELDSGETADAAQSSCFPATR